MLLGQGSDESIAVGVPVIEGTLPPLQSTIQELILQELIREMELDSDSESDSDVMIVPHRHMVSVPLRRRSWWSRFRAWVRVN